MLKKPSLRVQWILSLTVAIAFLVALVVLVSRADQTASSPDAPFNRAVVRQEDRDAVVLINADQAPHVALLAAGISPRAGLRAVLTRYVARQIDQGTIDGPLQRSTCRPAAGGTTSREVFTCKVEAGYVYYPFDAVVAPAARQVTYCKHDYPPVPTMSIPVSPSCT